jgi:TatD DNase family protein
MLIDAHAHIDKYNDLIDNALKETESYRVFTISNSMDPQSYKINLEIAERCKFVLPTFGIHPWEAHNYGSDLIALDEYIDQSPMLGELGLDYHFVKDSSLYPAQKKVLEYFLEKAVEQNKIITLHTKGAEKDVLTLLESYNIKRAIIHWYSGPLNILNEYLDKGYYFTVGVEILFTEHIRMIARNIPDDLLLTETDNPGGYEWGGVAGGSIGTGTDV